MLPVSTSDRSGNMGEPIVVRRAFLTLPMPFARREVINGRIATAPTADALMPAAGDQIGPTSIFVREHPLELSGGQLMNGFRSSSHDTPPTMEGYCHV